MDFPEGIGKSSPSDLGLSYGIFIHPDSFMISKHYITFKEYNQTKNQRNKDEEIHVKHQDRLLLSKK